MRPLLCDLPLAYLAELPPDLLPPALEAVPLARLLGPEAPVLARLWHEDAEPAPTCSFAAHVRTRLATVLADTSTTLTAHLEREGAQLLWCVTPRAVAAERSVQAVWHALAVVYHASPLLLGLPLLYEAHVAGLPATHRFPPSALAYARIQRDGRNARSPSADPGAVEAAQHGPPYVEVNWTAYSPHREVDQLVSWFLDALLHTAVLRKTIALVRVDTANSRVRTLLLHDRACHRVTVAVQTRRAAQYGVRLGDTTLWLDWLVPALKRMLRRRRFRGVLSAGRPPEGQLPELMLMAVGRAAGRSVPPDERSAVPWRADPPDLAADVALFLCELSAGEVAEPPIAPDCPRLVYALLPYLLPRHPNVSYEAVHAAVHAAAGVAAPVDLGPDVAVTHCARAHEALPTEARSPFAGRDMAAWSLFYMPPGDPSGDDETAK